MIWAIGTSDRHKSIRTMLTTLWFGEGGGLDFHPAGDLAGLLLLNISIVNATKVWWSLFKCLQRKCHLANSMLTSAVLKWNMQWLERHICFPAMSLKSSLLGSLCAASETPTCLTPLSVPLQCILKNTENSLIIHWKPGQRYNYFGMYSDTPVQSILWFYCGTSQHQGHYSTVKHIHSLTHTHTNHSFVRFISPEIFSAVSDSHSEDYKMWTS